ncbi:hypothetical protein LCGC14_0506850 [marine sediment metagenome]|uniref:Helicase ATP-binding domain-containing protein n=1 Tax=marine sediment metagenome TaxID=412755 RepID=A0A0F9S2F5_9ZZZZ
MRIVVGDIESKVYTKDVRVLGIIRTVCRARPAGFQFMPKFKKGLWDGYISLMSSHRSFPTGLLGYVVPALNKRGYKVDIDWGDHHTDAVYTVTPDMLIGITLRDYQVDAANKLLGARRGIAKMATNSGKTEVMAAMLKVLDKRAIIIIHRKELLHQTAERLETRLGRSIGKIGDGIHQPSIITVAMIQTLHNMKGHYSYQDYFQSQEVVMVDECHHTSSDQMMDVLYQISGKYRYGFSGTPLKNDVLADMKLISITGRVIYDLGNAELIEQGYSAVPEVIVHEVYSPEKANWDMDYHVAYDRLIVNNHPRNRIIKAVAEDRDGIVLILVTRIEHGDTLKRMIPGSVFVHGGITTNIRQNVLKRMKSGRSGVYIASTIFDEGVDVPDVNIMVLAGGGKSDIKLLQRIGRGLRKKEGRNIIEIHDFLDDTNEYLLKHTEERIDVYTREGFKVKIDKAETSISDTV